MSYRKEGRDPTSWITFARLSFFESTTLILAQLVRFLWDEITVRDLLYNRTALEKGRIPCVLH
jgi:hypothetical protein